MDEMEFWFIIAMLDWSKTGDDNAVLAPAVEYLSQLDDNALIQFHEILAQMLYEIDGPDWAEHMGDIPTVDGDPYYHPDTFLDARCCVVANGEEAYYDIKENPDHMPRDMEFKALLDLAGKAWAHKHRSQPDFEEFYCDPAYSFESFSNGEQWC